MICVWRLTRRAYASRPAEAFSGIGAERRAGRWNRAGTRAAYASSARSLAALEYLATIEPEDLPNDLVFVGAAFEDEHLRIANPPEGWSAAGSAVAKEYGESWLRSAGSLALAVPSAIVRAERNYVLNPKHPRARALAIGTEFEDFAFDARLLRR